jgi:membrane-bound lytic murein transglycosylase A
MPGRSYWKSRLFRVWAALLLPLAVIFPAQPALTALPVKEPVLADDLALHQLDIALNRSLVFLRKVKPTTHYSAVGRTIPVQRLIDSILHLQHLLSSRPDAEALDRVLNRDYEILQVNNPAKRMLITGYYQPVFPGCLDRQAPYIHPLYRVPEDLLIRRSNGKKQVIGRRENGSTTVPYWTRREIEKNGLLRGQELIWLKDPFDAFVVHIQGSGIVRLPDGSNRGVHYAMNNGHPYRSVGKHMVDTGRMRLTDVTMDSLRRYIEAHPEERDTLLHHNDSFIFFEWSEPGPAIGNLGQALTPGRSIAADQQWYPPGSLVFLDSRRPIMADDGSVREWQPMQRLVTVQDSGSALTGPGRIDLFWGTGEQAGQEAGQMKEEGIASILLLKEND